MKRLNPHRRIGPIVFALGLGFSFGGPPLIPGQEREVPAQRFIRGDVNADGIVSQADILAIIRSLYLHSKLLLPCADAADADDSGAIDITDMIALVNFLYLNGRYPAPPYLTPGVDPTPDALGCEAGRVAGGGASALMDTPRADGDEDDGQVIDFLEFFASGTEGYPGETGLRVPIQISNSRELDGFTVCVHADPTKVWLQRIELADTLPGREKPASTRVYRGRQVDGYLALSVFMDYLEPFEGNRFARGARSTVANLVFSLSPEVKPGETVRLEFADLPPGDDFRPAPINEFGADGRSIRPRLDPRGLEVAVSAEGELFLRGDANRDLAINITDVILILRYLFLGERLVCLDAADIDDSGQVDISDVIALAKYLFDHGWAPSTPFPNPGHDPSPDGLEDCR